MSSLWCTHDTYMVTEIKEHDVRAHGHGMMAFVIRRVCGQTWTRVRVKTLDNY